MAVADVQKPTSGSGAPLSLVELPVGRPWFIPFTTFTFLTACGWVCMLACCTQTVLRLRGEDSASEDEEEGGEARRARAWVTSQLQCAHAILTLLATPHCLGTSHRPGDVIM